MVCSLRVGGVVSGSVRITPAKNKNGEYKTMLCIPATRSVRLIKLSASVTTTAVARKLNTKSLRRVFRTINRLPTSTNGSIGPLPTHQLAVWLTVSAVSATANATGLNRCLPLIARIYLDPIAQTAAQPRNHKSWNEVRGVMINARISAEI